MPGNLILTQPDAVMPIGLMASFSEEAERPALADGVWSNGETVRFALTLQPRRVFRLTRKLDPAGIDQLRTFLLDHKCKPFWFYNLRETQPPGSWDETGINPIGRYAVVWQGGMTLATDLGRRGAMSIELREVEI